MEREKPGIFETEIARLRIASFTEAISWIILLFIGVPLKYLGGNPIMVKIFGPIHGFLFVVLCLALLLAGIEAKWKFKYMVGIFVAALLPFVPFFIDSWLKREEENHWASKQASCQLAIE